jgi:hypothetical protein
MNFLLSLLFSISMFTLLFASAFYRGLYGLDWTDSTYTFQEALNVLNGLIPHKDTSPPVPGLSFVLEAWALKLFGVNYFVHRWLGFAVLVFTFVGFFFVCRLLFKKTADAIVVSLLGAVPHLGSQSWFSFTPLALMMTIWIAAAFMYSKNVFPKKITFIYSLSIGSALACLTLVKQNIGILIIVSIFIGVAFIKICRYLNIKFSCKEISAFFLYGISIGLILTFSLYFSYVGSEGVINLIELLQNSNEIKGLDQTSFFEKITSGFGVVNSTKGVGLFILFLTISYGLFELKSKPMLIWRKFLFYSVALSPLLLVWESSGITLILVWYLHQSVILAKLAHIVRRFFDQIKVAHQRKVSIKSLIFEEPVLLFLVLLILEAGIIAHQMSWHGVFYMSFELSYLAAIVATYSFVSVGLFEFGDFFKPLLKQWAVLITSIILIYGQVAPVKNRRVITFDENNYQTVEVIEFSNFLVSKTDASAILRIRSFVKQCDAQTMFQLPWAPILYSITGLKNSTRFFLPYADTITEANGIAITNELKSNPPDIFIVEPYRVHIENPFPAKGMKIIYSYVESSKFHEIYGAALPITTDYKEWLIYCRAR